MEAGAKERERYKDIEWLMPSVDLEAVLGKLGIIIDGVVGDDIRALCPDHRIYTGHESSDPNWFLSKTTGKTICFTEGRGSNLVWTVCRLLKKEPDEVAKFLTGLDNDGALKDLALRSILVKAQRMKEVVTKEHIKIRGLDAISKELSNRKTSQRLYDFFKTPPGKKYPTNIAKETVDRYQVFERTWGFYEDRAIIPYFIKKELVGFCAIDLLGKEVWCKKHPALEMKDYRKVRYPTDFLSSECLFGFDDCTEDAEFIVITEGAREVMKLRQEGFQAVAILGAYIGDGHKKLLTELHPRKVVLMFDGDDAGVAITSRTAMELANLYSPDRIVKCFPPRGRDPKNLNRDELRELIKKNLK